MFYLYSMSDEIQKILVVCSFADREIKYPTPRDFDMDRAQLILCNYDKPKGNVLRPFECKVYLWK